MNAPAASRGRAPRNEVLLVERVLHADDLNLQPANQLIDLNSRLPLCFLFLNLIGSSYNSLLLASYFGFQNLNALLVLVKFTKSLLVHALDLANRIFICLCLNLVTV